MKSNKIAIFCDNQKGSTGFYVYNTLKELGFEVDIFSPFSAYLIKEK